MRPNTSDRVRVLVLTKGLEVGGVENLLVAQARLRNETAFEYFLFYLRSDLDRLRSRFEFLGVPVECGGMRREWDLRWIWRLRRAMLRHRIDVIHTHLPYVAAFTRLMLLTIPAAHRPTHIYTEHCVWDGYAVPTRWLNRITYRLNNHSFAVSERVRTEMPRHVRDSTVVLLHGIDLNAARAAGARRAEVRREWDVADDTVVIGCVANHRPTKALHDLLEAALMVRGAASDVLFVQIGDGPLTNELLAQHAHLGLGRGFRFLGQRPDAIELMAGMDIFAMSSVAEGLPVAVMEASALGLPVVATHAGGVPEIVKDGETGLLVPPGQPRALAAALLGLVDDSSQRAALGRAAREHSQRFDMRHAVGILESSYRACAMQRQTR